MVTPYGEGAILKAGRTARSAYLEELTGSGGLLVLTPHPDDESLGCGGAIASASASGTSVTVVALTDGSRSHPHSRIYPRDRLVALREKELKDAVAQLTMGRGKVITLGVPDQGTVSSTEYDLLAAHLLGLVDAGCITSIWTTWEGDPHPDHYLAASLARTVVCERPDVALWRFPVWGRFMEANYAMDELLIRFDTSAFRDRKAAAIAAHRSQISHFITDDPSGFVMEPQTLSHFLDAPEYFLRASLGG